jgi:hypothetical protein
MRLNHLFAPFLLCLALQAQDPAVREAFLQAKAAWAAQGNREDATARFEQVVASLAPRAKNLDADSFQVLCESYNWLAVLDDRSAATKPRTQVRFQALISLNADFELDRAMTSQRLVALHDRLRGEKYAPVRISFAPEGGQLLVDGQPSAAVQRKFLPFGTHRLSYQRPGHTPQEQTLEVAPREARTLAFNLPRIASTLRFHTSPAGPEVLLDGRSLGHTAGKAGAEDAALAISLGLRPEDLSGPFVIPELPPGKHRLELRGPCFRPRILELGEDLAKPFADHTLEPIRMAPSRGTLTVRSAWPGGELFLSGEARGPLPVTNLNVCAGSYDLMVRFPAGGFSRRITVEDGKAMALEVQPRPRLAYLGLEGGEFTGKARFAAMLAGFGERLEQLAFLAPGRGETPAAALARLKASREAELVLIATPVADKVIHRLELTLATLDGEEERLEVKPLEEDPLATLAARLNHLPRLQQPGLGLILLDLPDEPGPWVLSASQSAQKAGIQVGQALTALNDQAVATTTDLLRALALAKDSVTVKQGDRTLTLLVQKDALEVPLGRPEFSYPAVLAQLHLRYRGVQGEEANLLKLNMGLTLMHFRKYDKAIEMLRDTHLNATQGISQGTLDYHLGRCFLRLGPAYLAEATQAFRQALKYPQATLLSPDGPLVTPLAQQALDDLK